MLIFDIETKTFGKPDPNKDEFKFIGAYEYETDQYHFLSWQEPEKIIDLFKKHRVVVSFNGDHYDIPILKRHGLWKFQHTHIDTREVCRKRQYNLKLKGESLSLDNIGKVLKLEQQKQDNFDYTLLNKSHHTSRDLEEIKEYTLQDIRTTKKLYDYLAAFFEPFKEFIGDWDRRNYKWLTTSSSVYAYKVVCYMAGIQEEYADHVEHKTYEGGFVALPTQSEAHGNIYCLDFNSLYPHNYIQGNLYSHSCKCCTYEEKWKGNGVFPVKGSYCTKTQGKIERAIQTIYNLRKRYKSEGNPLEQALKLVINVIYGISGNPSFKNVYNLTTAADCTLIGRNATKLARRRFREAGYKILYTDTDSVYIQDVWKDKKTMLKVRDRIIQEIKSNLPHPTKTFDMGIDDEIEHIWFFKDDSGKYIKKNYMYVTTDNKLVIKGLAMIKSDSSKIGYYIFNKYMKEQIKTGRIMFEYKKISEFVYEEINKNLMLVARQFKVNDYDTYKSGSSIQAQIAKIYGPGKHFLIPNRFHGVGKGIKYCTKKEFLDNGFNANAIILNKMWNELKQFLDEIPVGRVAKTKKNKAQRGLTEWTNIEV